MWSTPSAILFYAFLRLADKVWASLCFAFSNFIITESLKQLWVGDVFFGFGSSGLQELVEAEEFAAEGAGVGGPLGFAGMEGQGGSGTSRPPKIS